MKKISLSLTCLLSITATGYSQQKENKFSHSQVQSVFRNEDKWSLAPVSRPQLNLLSQHDAGNFLYNCTNEVIAGKCTILCSREQLFIDKIIHQLFKEQF